MAGPWLKMECATPDKPEVLAITARMGWDDPDLTVGKLFRLWRWFDQHTVDGNADGVTSALLDRVVGVTGFVTAVASVGWLVATDAGVLLKNFDRHNGETAKQRAQTAKRVAGHKSNAKGNAEGNAASVTKSVPRGRGRELLIPSDADASAGEPALAPAHASPLAAKDIVFALGVPLLTGANVKESNARSFLAMQAKVHGDEKVAEALQRCCRERPVEPVSWLQTALGPIKGGRKVGKHAGFEQLDYHDGVTEDGFLT